MTVVDTTIQTAIARTPEFYVGMFSSYLDRSETRLAADINDRCLRLACCLLAKEQGSRLERADATPLYTQALPERFKREPDLADLSPADFSDSIRDIALALPTEASVLAATDPIRLLSDLAVARTTYTDLGSYTVEDFVF